MRPHTLTCVTQMCLTCVFIRKLCAPDSVTRPDGVTHCGRPLPSGLSLTPTFSRHVNASCEISDALCSWSGKLCAPDSFSRSSSVTLRPLLPQGSSLTLTLSRHFCPPTSVSVCEGPEAFLLHHTLVWGFHTLCARAASSCQHSVFLAPLSQQSLATLRVEKNASPP